MTPNNIKSSAIHGMTGECPCGWVVLMGEKKCGKCGAALAWPKECPKCGTVECLSGGKKKPPTANQITAALLIEIPKRHRDSICWRNNTGSGIGWAQVKAAIGCLRRRDIDGALRFLTRPMGFGLIGSSDIIVVMGPRGRFVGIEVKVDDQQSHEQVAFEKRITALGGVYILARDVDECLLELAGIVT